MRTAPLVATLATALALAACSQQAGQTATPAHAASVAAPAANGAPKAAPGSSAAAPNAASAGAGTQVPAVTPTAPSSIQAAAATAVPSGAVTQAAQPGLDWANLATAVGQYPRDVKLLTGGIIGAQVAQLVGGWLPKLQQNLQVSGPIEKAGGIYYVTGNAPHQGGAEQAYIMLDARHKAMEIGLWQNGRLSVYATAGVKIAKPADINVMLQNARERP